MALHLVTAGESHGPALVAIVTGLPAGLRLDKEAIDADLRRRQQGYGRSPRQKLESDEVEVLAGLRHGETLGTPLALVVRNRDHANWTWGMSPWPPEGDARPGRARSPSRCPGRATPTSPESSSTTTTTSATRSSVPRRATRPSTSRPARSRRHSSASSGSRSSVGRSRSEARRRRKGCGSATDAAREGSRHARRDRRGRRRRRPARARLVRGEERPARRAARVRADGDPGGERRRDR